MIRMNDHRQLREVFHLLFLGRLLRVSDPALYALKGGVNLRWFFKSPRYSEDMDLDVRAGAAGTLAKNVYKILEDKSFSRSLASFGIDELLLNDPAKAKQTETTRRFRVRLVTSGGDALPTKIEFSRREAKDKPVMGTIDPEIARLYRQLAFACPHYSATVAVRQKIAALAHRRQVQARDVFDLNLLWLGGHLDQDAIAGAKVADRELARSNLSTLDFDDYASQVVEYLETEQVEQFGSEVAWAEMSARLLDLLAP